MEFVINDYPLSSRVGPRTAILSSLNVEVIALSHIYGLIQQRKSFQNALSILLCTVKFWTFTLSVS